MAAGGDLDAFWLATPRTFVAFVEGRQDMAASAAWWSEFMVRQKKFETLSHYLSTEKRKPVQTNEEISYAMKRWVRATKVKEKA